jgi:uncharacterized membrane protein YkvA (DUF1232 family)
VRAFLVIVVALVALWAAMLAALALVRPRGIDLVSAARAVPDMVRLLRALAGDPATGRRARVLLVLLLGYLAVPIDVVPDFVPVLGYADDAIVVALVLRSVVRRAGSDAVARHWRGTPEGLALVRRICGLAEPDHS